MLLLEVIFVRWEDGYNKQHWRVTACIYKEKENYKANISDVWIEYDWRSA